MIEVFERISRQRQQAGFEALAKVPNPSLGKDCPGGVFTPHFQQGQAIESA